jgi:hypothetical protein
MILNLVPQQTLRKDLENENNSAYHNFLLNFVTEQN